MSRDIVAILQDRHLEMGGGDKLEEKF